MSYLNHFRKQLTEGQTYRFEELKNFSDTPSHHANALLKEGYLEKLARGLYYCPKKSRFGLLPPDTHELMSKFLDGEPYLLASLDDYNSLGLGLTQLHNETLVYNHYRFGKHKLGKQNYYFLKRLNFPEKPDEYFLMVDLMNNLRLVGEDEDLLKERVLRKAETMDLGKLMDYANMYGLKPTKKFFKRFEQKRMANTQ